MIETLTPIADWVLILPVLLPLFGGAVLLMMRSLAARWHVLVAAIVLLCTLGAGTLLLARVLADGPLSMTMGKWLPPFGISFTADALGAGLALVAALATLFVLIYAHGEPRDADGRAGFHALVLLLLAGVSGSFLTGDLFNLYVWFEVMLIASFGLLVQGGRPIELDATVKYGFLNFLATTFFLLSLGLTYGLLGTLNMADIALSAGRADPAALTAVSALLLLAFATKAAAFPVNAWLPASYHAPSPAISALMAGLLTKVGVYALLRTLVALVPEGREALAPVITTVAIVTLVVAPLGAIAETNLRRAIGFIVIGGIGATLIGLAVPGPRALEGTGIYIVHAMLTMTALYFAAGLIEAKTGETDTRRMGGLYAASSPLSIVFLLLVLASAGVPPLIGFWPKLLLLDGALGAGSLAGNVLAVALLVNAFLTLVAGSRLWAHVFWRAGTLGSESELPNPGLRPLSAGQLRWGAPATAALATLVLAAGLWPDPLMVAAQAAAADLLDPARYIAAVGLAGVQP